MVNVNVSSLSYFVKPSVLKKHSIDLTEVSYTSSSNHLSKDGVYIGDDTLALITHLSENEREPVKKFYEHVITFYQRFIAKLIKVFDFVYTFLH